jgi:hypothetical protein
VKKIASILLWLLCATHLHGQGFIKAEYFIDTDPGLNNGIAIPLSTSSDTAVFSANIAIGTLSTGFHSVSIRMLHNDGTWGLFETRLFYVTPPISSDAANFAAAEYFIDSDPGVGNGTALAITAGNPTVTFTAAITTSLSTGFHSLAIRTKDLDGRWGLFETRWFYIMPALTADVADITAAEYFIDTDPGVGNATALSVGASGAVVNFSASVTASLSVGFHSLSIRTKDTDGRWGMFETRLFYITPPLSADVANITAAEYFIDADPGVGNATALSVGASGAVVNFSASVTASLSVGFHSLSIRTKDLDGKWGMFETRLFYITPPISADVADITAAEYFIDTDPGVGNATALSVGTSGAVVNFSPSVTASLTPGFHTLSIRTKDLNGRWGLFETRLFHISQPTTDMPVITAAEFFFDTDPGVGNANPLTIPGPGDTVSYTASAVVPCLGPGTHYMCIRMRDQNNRWGLFQHDTVTVQSGVASAVVTPAGPITICATDLVTLSAPNAAGIVYQWLLNGSPIAGATGSSYNANSAGNYSLRTSCNSSFATSNVVVVNTIPVDTFYADTDSDGFGDLASPSYACFQPTGTVTNSDDCNDGNSAIHPNATEICNGVDDDCDGLTDDADPSVTGRPTWYADTDGDGFGNPSSTVLACVQPSGYVANNTDCNDGNSNVNPNAQEICNNTDDDCDGLTDDADPSATGQSNWYVDADGDGFGNASISVFLCAAPSGYVGNDDDCNDGNNAIHPAADEVCNGIDDDCDGLTDNADPSVTGQPVWYADVDGDGYGNPLASLLSCTQPSGYISDDNDCNDTDAAVHPLATEVCNGYDDDCDGLIDVTDPSLVDTEPPVITCANDTVISTEPGQCGVNVIYALPTATDNCAIASIVQIGGSSSNQYFVAGTITNTFVATDVRGNTDTCSFTITIVDSEAPVISCPANITVNSTPGLCGTVVSYNVTYNDNCSAFLGMAANAIPSGNTFPVGTTTNSFTVTDPSGNSASCSFTVTVIDIEAPVITGCPANISVNADAGNCNAIVTWSAPTPTDNCSMQSLTSSYSSGSAFPLGTTTVTYTASDVYGNSSICMFTVTVNPNSEVCGNGIDDNCNGQIDEDCCAMTVNAGADETTYFGYSGDQSVTRSATITGGTAPFTYSWTLDRPLLCNQVNSVGDEAFSGGTCVNNSCPSSGSPTLNPVCINTSITATLIDTATVCVTVTDANGCTATDCFVIDAVDARCFSGNSSNNKIKVCHYTGSQSNPWVSICIPDNAVQAHLQSNTQDYVGRCIASRPEELQENTGLEVFPNPATDRLMVKFSSTLQQDYIMTLVDITGREVLTVSDKAVEGINMQALDLSSMAKGIYLFEIRFNEINHQMRIIIQ